MATAVKPIPDGFGSLTPHITVDGASKAIQFYQEAFGAEELVRMPGPGGKLMHAELRIGDSMLMLNDEFPEYGSRGPKSIGGTAVTLSIYTENVDALFDRAVKAGAKVVMPLQDMFWGDRYGQLEDPFGHRWGLATHKEDLTPEEIGSRAAQAGF